VQQSTSYLLSAFLAMTSTTFRLGTEGMLPEAEAIVGATESQACLHQEYHASLTETVVLRAGPLHAAGQQTPHQASCLPSWSSKL